MVEENIDSCQFLAGLEPPYAHENEFNCHSPDGNAPSCYHQFKALR